LRQSGIPEIEGSNSEESSRSIKNEYKDCGLEGVMKGSVRILDPDVLRFWHDPLIGIGIFYIAIKSQTLKRYRAVK
jgi:hypothetical protein